MNNINHRCLKIVKQITTTQILSIFLAIIGNLYMGLVINYDWLFTNTILLSIELILLIILYVILISLFSEGKWTDIPLIFIPYIIYWFIISTKSHVFFPTNTDPNDYGVGIIGLVIFLGEYISVLIASILGTCLNKRKKHAKSVH